MDKTINEIAQELYQRDKAAWGNTYQLIREDTEFLSDKPGCQWDRKEYDFRVSLGVPAYQVDQLSQFIHQVENDIRMNTPTINVIPSDSKADKETAEVLKGLIKDIEYKSGADDVYDTASRCAVRGSLGFIRVDHDYVDDEAFEQQLIIKRVINPLAVLIDCDSIEVDGRDAKHGTVLDKILVSDYRRNWPDKEVSCFESDKIGREYKEGDYVTIAEFFRIEESEREEGVDENGEREEVQEGKEYKTTRKLKKKTVKRYKLSGRDILEETTFPGKYIPIVPVYGEEAWIDGVRHIYSLIRKSKDAQKMYNLWKSLETESLLRQQMSPVTAPAGATEDFAADYANPRKASVLRYNAFDANGNALPRPERLAPPTVPTGFINASRGTVEDIKSTLGMYNASVGQKSNAISGVAIARQQQEGDVATFHFGDNLAKSITQVGRILVCAIPEIYDNERIIRVIGEDQTPKEVGINGKSVKGQERTYNLREGSYTVRVVTGPSFTTQRQETAAALQEFMGGNPEMAANFLDLFFQTSDFAGAQALMDRAKKVMNPQLFADENTDEDPRIAQLTQALQQVQSEAQQAVVELQTQLQSKQTEEQIKAQEIQVKAQSEQGKSQLDAAKLQIEAQKNQQDYELKLKELQLKERELALKEQEILLKSANDAEKNQIQRDGQEQSSALELAQIMQPAQTLGNEANAQGDYDD